MNYEIGLGELEKTVSVFEKVYAEHDSQTQFFNIELHFDTLRAESRF